jgi:hypothetical protein
MVMQATPVVFSESNKKFLPIQKNGNVYPFFRHDELIDEVETFGDVLSRLGARDEYRIGRERLVGKVIEFDQPSRTYCGGEVYYWVGFVKESVSRFDMKGLSGIYISMDDDGRLHTAIPA